MGDINPLNNTPKEYQRAYPDLEAIMLILRLPAVKAYVSLSKSTVYDLIHRGLFPPPVRIGVRAVGWRESDILDWIESRVPIM